MSDDTDPDTLGGAFRKALASASSRARTWQPGRVESYNATTGRADVQPLIGRRVRGRDGRVTVEYDPVIPDVPVGFQGAGGVRIRFPVSKGDIVILMFCERSLDRFKGGVRKKHDPGEVRTHSASDAIAIPGVIDTGDDAAATIEFTADGKIQLGTGAFVPTGPTGDQLVKAGAIDPFTGQTQAVLNPTKLTTTTLAK